MNTPKNLFSAFSIPFYLLLIALGLVSVSCSQESNSFVARTYHNLLARDNPYFLARERMKTVETKVYDLKEDNYNGVLHPIPPFDTLKTKGLAAQLDDIIKKASIPVRRHKNSDYVDDSYVLIGRCRMYKGEFKMGIETYKYVNAHGKNVNDKNEALIYLMRAYMAANQFENAKTVSDHLDKQDLTLKNKTIYNVTKAEYLRIYERYDEMIPLLEEVAHLQKKRDIRSRMYFILGQLYQRAGNDTAAYKNYHKVVKSNPPYEMLFISKLNLYQVTNIEKEGATKKINKYYTKLLKDPKNEEYKDKIYYEMALFEYKQKNLPKAIEHLKASSKASKAGGYQKGFTYLKLAEIYYEDLEDYENAAAYYDSTATTFNKKDKRYPLISKREKILDEFVKQLSIIKRQDSLLTVAKMDSVTLNNLIDSLIAKEQADYMAKQLALKKKKFDEENAPLTPDPKLINSDPTAASWYFSNAAAIQNGINEFNLKWGRRPLEDNWRRSKKEAVVDFDNPGSKDSTQAKTDPDPDARKGKNDIEPLKIDRSKYYVDIPVTDSQKVAANKKIEDAMFQVASIYNHKLEEPRRAIRTYEQLLARYPETLYEPEILYNLYLICKELNDPKQEQYKNRLLEKHPNSLYAKLIRNPNYYRDTKIANKYADVEYKDVYNFFKNNQFEEADSAATLLLAKYPESDVVDKLTYVKIICQLKTKGPSEKVLADIETFPDLFPESPLVPVVKDLSAAIKKQTIQNEKDAAVKETAPPDDPAKTEPTPAKP
ncbi:MAG: tetratricopeptide repeat protein [Cytophaga sp.]|uniref:type IX secretion system periplasmic lipoprotein PorW/SprE n=1 Tax=Cytophaga sp. TaxID=29535 RepID=UPI003F7E4815